MENMFFRLVMLVATGITAYLPMANIFNRRLSLKRDILMILFWYQSWIYLHVVPTINGLFPNSSFAYPPGFEDVRVIQFTSANLGLYAAFQAMILVLFYIPFICTYLHCRRKVTARHVEVDRPRLSVYSDRLFLLALVYSIFGLMFYEVANRTGLLSPYAMSLDVFASISRYDHWVWRIYVVTSPFLLTVILLAFFERDRRISIVPCVIAFAPGLALHVVWLFTSSRAVLVFLIVGVIGILTARGHVRRPSNRMCCSMVLSFLIIWYGFTVIPTLRVTVLQESVTVADCLDALNPFTDNGLVPNSGSTDIGFRLDGIELMVLATPRMLEIGPSCNSRYLVSIVTPIIPIIPSLERSLKFEERTLDFKKYYMGRYTDIPYKDYPAGTLADIFIVLGPLGFCVAALTFGWLFTWIQKLVAVSPSSWSIILGVFFYYNISSFEFSFASVLMGWVRGLPVLLVAIVLNPFRGCLNGGHGRPACIHANRFMPPCHTVETKRLHTRRYNRAIHS